jgi:hypothetical protein
MVKTLANRSDFLKIKYKFFINRLVIYFSFLLIPLWLQKSIELNLFLQSIILLMYMLFMGGQWYLLGKEVDHRLKIYYRANSSMDRILYRLVLGNIFVILFYNILNLFPIQFTEYAFWGFFITMGLYYSWPTRGKIIEESMAGQFGEFKFLDSFERTVLFLTVIMFLSSLPEVSLFQNIDALKLYFDPLEKIHFAIWNFLQVNYLPFHKYSKLYNLAWSYHVFFYGLGIYLLAFYSVVRFFFSRRLSILAVFALVSTWSFSKILGANIVDSYTTTYLIVWVWSILWATKSATYRSGLFTGLVLAWGSMINVNYSYLLPITIISVYTLFLKEHTSWYRNQWVKYNLAGVMITILVLISHFEMGKLFDGMGVVSFFILVIDFIYRKAFFTLSIFGALLTAVYFSGFYRSKLSYVSFEKSKLRELIFSIATILILGLFFNSVYLKSFSFMWVLAFFSLIPLEWIFQSISRLRSKRNIIYVLYILFCLLDSHFEGRIRIIGKMFLEDEVYKYINQM